MEWKVWRQRRRVTDNANEAVKMKPRVTVVAGGGFDSGGVLEPFNFFGDVFADVAGLGWRCLSSESDIGEREEGGGGVVEGLGCPRRCIYELALNSLANSDPNTRAVFTTNGQRESRRW